MSLSVKLICILIFVVYSNCAEEVEFSKNQITVGLISLSSHGHISPLLTLANEIRNQGHKVIFFSSEDVQKKLEGKVDEFVSLGTEASMENVIMKAFGEEKEELSFFDVPSMFAQAEREFLKQLLPIFKNFKENNNLPDVLVVDFLAFAGFDICDYFDIPCVVGLPGLYPPLFKPNWLPGNSEGLSLIRRLKGQAFKIITFAINYAFHYLSNDVRSEFGIKPWDHFGSSLFAGNIIFQFSFSPLVEPGPSISGITNLVGVPFIPKENPTLDDSIINWINNQRQNGKKIIYVSFGTIAKQSPEQLQFWFNEFSKCTKYSFIWSLRDNMASRLGIDNNLNSIPHILHVTWIDQIAVLNYVDLFFTHGGYNSLSESIYYNVPVVCMPFMAEQPENCARVEQLKIGTQISNDDLELDLCSVFEKVLEDNESKENMQMLSDFAKSSSKFGLQSGVETLVLIAKYGAEPLIPMDFSYSIIERLDWDIYIIHLTIAFTLGIFIVRCCCFPTKQPAKQVVRQTKKRKKN